MMDDPSMDRRLNRIEELCKSYLFSWSHISRREKTERLIRQLHEATAPVESAEPPPLGVSVSDSLAVRSKVGG